MALGSLLNNPADHNLGRSRGFWSAIHLDPLLLVLLLLLMGAGLFVLYSGADRNIEVVKAQGIRFGVALVVMFVFAQLDPAVFRRWAPWLYAVGMVGLVAVLLVGVGAKGAQRWLAIPGLPRFQPSEFMKLVVPMMAAWYLSRHFLPPRLRHVAVGLILVLVPMALIVQQPDLGTSLLVGMAGIFVVFFAGMSWKLISAFFALVSISAPMMWFFVMRDYQKQRVLTLLDPQSDPLGAGWNIIQSKTAIGSGGMDGKGWLQGTQSHLEFLPESHTDFIVAVLAEDFGFIGMLLLPVHCGHRPGFILSFAGRCLDHDLLYLCFCECGYGQRFAACGGCAFTTGQLRGHVWGNADGCFRGADVDPHPSPDDHGVKGSTMMACR
jgi:rod shape determining protein RodA